MGCGAICGEDSGVVETNHKAQIHLKQLFSQIAPNQFLYPIESFVAFAKQLQVNAHKFQLPLTNKLEHKSAIPTGVMDKWKIILYGLDSDNPSYINCLGYPQKRTMGKSSHLLIEQQQNQKNREVQKSQTELMPHKCFPQIQKDLDRTFPMPSVQRDKFAHTLKKISNYFPKMGYTQGINFIVGYLFVVGYSDQDAFWMFMHIALNRKYMLLGLFEDGFPLSSVYIILFRNMLKRFNRKLYNHLYETVVVDESIWVFKWFITYYLYSFPLQMCQYIWDIVISVGGIGLVTFAVSLVHSLQKQLLEVEDPCQISEFFQELKQMSTFNSLIRIKEVVKTAYDIKVQKTDLEGLKNLMTSQKEPNIYAQYMFTAYNAILDQQAYKSKAGSQDQLSITDPVFFQKVKITGALEILDQWYLKLINERSQFSKSNSNIMGMIESGNQIESQNKSVQKQIKSDELNIKEESHRNSFSENQNSYLEDNCGSEDLRQSKQQSNYRQSLPTHPNAKRSSLRCSKAKRTQEKVLQDKLDDDQLQLQEKGDIIMNMEDDFNYVHPRNKRKKQFHKFKHDPSNSSKTYRDRSNDPQDLKFVPIAHNMLNPLSISNSSSSSINNVQKQNNKTRPRRYCNCRSDKNRTEQKSQQGDSSGKQSLQHDSLEKMMATNNRKRFNTYNNWATTSQTSHTKAPSLVKNLSELGSEVQICNGKQMFKKKNGGRIVGVVSISSDINRIIETDDLEEYCEHEEPKLGFQQESFDSIMIGNGSSQKSSVLSCENESVR